MIAVTLTVLERRRHHRHHMDDLSPSASRGSGHRIHDNLSVGIPALRADNTNDLDAKRNVTTMPPDAEGDEPKG